MLCRVAVAAAVLTGGLVTLGSTAEACSCSDDAFGPPKVLFQGRATEVVGQGHLDSVWRFDVTRVVRGDVSDPQDAEVATGGESACGLQTAPVVAGVTYEVGAYPGETAVGEPALFVGYCGGSLRQLQAAPPAGGASAAPAAERTDEADGPPAGWVWLALGGLAVAGAGGAAAVIRRARRHRVPA